MKTFELSPSMLAYCQGVWDDENKIYIPDDSYGVLKCCLDSCEKRKKNCQEKCVGNNCNIICKTISTACIDNCLEYSPESLNTVKTCAENNSCGEYPPYSRDCMIDKKNAIIDCCKKSCISTENDDCGKGCNNFYNFLLPQSLPKENYIFKKNGFVYITPFFYFLSFFEMFIRGKMRRQIDLLKLAIKRISDDLGNI